MTPRQTLVRRLFLAAAILFALGAPIAGLTTWIAWTHGESPVRSAAGVLQAIGMALWALGLWRSSRARPVSPG